MTPSSQSNLNRKLFDAIRRNDLEAVNDLLNAGVNPNARTSSIFRLPALSLVARDNRNVAIAEAILTAGADVNAKDRYGLTPLQELLLKRLSENTLSTTDQPVHHSPIFSFLKFLIDNRAEVNVCNDRDETPLMWAAECDDCGILNLLIEAGADINARDNYGNSPLMYAAAANHSNSKIFRILIEHGTNVNDRNNEGQTPLIIAARSKTPSVLAVLIEAGADLNSQDKDGRTALHWAARKNESKEIAKTLIDAGADIEARDQKNFTPIMHAAGHNRSVEVMKILIDAGANVNAKSRSGITARMLAAAANTKEILDLLIASGAKKLRDELEQQKKLALNASSY